MEHVLSGEASAKSKFLALISYLGILCLVPLLVNKDDDYVNFHARQGLILWVWGVLAIFGLYVPGVGHMFFSISAMLIMLLSIFGMLSVVLTKAWKFPFIGDLAEKI